MRIANRFVGRHRLVLAGVFLLLTTLHVSNGREVSAQERANSAPEDPGGVNPISIIENYCIDCHRGADASGERDFETLDFAKSDFDTQLKLQEIIDQLTLETMPPEDGERLSVKLRLAAIEKLTKRLQAMREQTKSVNQSATVLRRLSRREYRRTVGDLLAIDMTMFDPTMDFPGESLAEHFDNVGEALVTSGHLLERYLESADLCVEKALSVTERPSAQEWVFNGNFRTQAELSKGHKVAFDNRYLCLYDHPLNDKPEGAFGHLTEFKDGVPTDGLYEIRVHAKSMNRDTPYGDRAVRIKLEEPFRMGIRPGDTSIEDMFHTQPIQPLLDEAIVSDDDFQWYTFRVRLDKGFVPRFTFENGIHNVRSAWTRVYKNDLDKLPESIRKEKGIYDQRIAIIKNGHMPHIRIDQVKIRGPIEIRWPTSSQLAVLGQESFDESNIMELIKKFASRAFRRPVEKQELEQLDQFYHARLSAGHVPEQAFKDSLKAVLCSPAFLYFQTPSLKSSRNLTDHAIAERLSYFLTSSMPDDELRLLADRGQLSKPAILREQVRRLLGGNDNPSEHGTSRDNASDAFVTDFLDSWLNLRSLGSMPPDPNLFWQFYAGGLQEDMKTETRMLFRDLIERDAPAVEMLTADYSFINRDLAAVYGIEHRFPAESAHEFRRMSFENPLRGGLLGQASILTVSANGIETSPVVRGVWMLENILGTPTPPPPDDVPAIDPDTRGAKTIRDQLSKHRDHATCFQCHRKIDPLGFAMEQFNAIGQQRSFYDTKRKHAIDSSGELPGGEKFDGLPQLKQLLVKREKFFVRTLTKRLLTHALGRHIGTSDRQAVDGILAQLEDQNYPTARLIESIVLSELFIR